jgi:hypothetical protein
VIESLKASKLATTVEEGSNSLQDLHDEADYTGLRGLIQGKASKAFRLIICIDLKRYVGIAGYMSEGHAWDRTIHNFGGPLILYL